MSRWILFSCEPEPWAAEMSLPKARQERPPRSSHVISLEHTSQLQQQQEEEAEAEEAGRREEEGETNELIFAQIACIQGLA